MSTNWFFLLSDSLCLSLSCSDIISYEMIHTYLDVDAIIQHMLLKKANKV